MENDKTRDEIEREVRDILSMHRGKEQAISRWQLVEIVFGRKAAADRGNNNRFDRIIRSVIEKYRDVDLICSTSSASGYWIAANMNDVEAIAEEFDKRAKGMLAKKSRILEHGKNKFGGQLELV